MSNNKKNNNHNSNILSARNLKKTFVSGAGTLEVLKGIDLDIQKGHIVSVVGPSGAGKSTLMHILGGLDRPSSGSVLLDGTDIFTYSDAQLAEIRNSKVGFLFQFHHLLSEFTALENVAIPASIKGLSVKEAHEKGQSLLEQLGLGDRGHHRPGELSGGEQQRVALARALINDPPVLLADEPTGNLDRHTGWQVLDLLFNLRDKRDLTVVIVTHDQEMAQKTDRRIKVSEGQILEIE
jgi:lipoprotein-releasing system ATP-binding protein